MQPFPTPPARHERVAFESPPPRAIAPSSPRSSSFSSSTASSLLDISYSHPSSTSPIPRQNADRSVSGRGFLTTIVNLLTRLRPRRRLKRPGHRRRHRPNLRSLSRLQTDESGRSHKLRFSPHSSSSTVNLDLAYGSGFIRYSENKTQDHRRDEYQDHRVHPDYHPDLIYPPNASASSRTGPLTSVQATTDDKLLALGRQLSDLAARQNDADLFRAGRTRPSQLLSAASKLKEAHQSLRRRRNRSLPPGVAIPESSPESVDEPDWESVSGESHPDYTSSDGDDLSEDHLAYGLASFDRPSRPQTTKPLPPVYPNRPDSPPYHRSSYVESRTFGPVNSLGDSVKPPSKLSYRNLSQPPDNKTAPPVVPTFAALDPPRSELNPDRPDSRCVLQQPVPIFPISPHVYETDWDRQLPLGLVTSSRSKHNTTWAEQGRPREDDQETFYPAVLTNNHSLRNDRQQEPFTNPVPSRQRPVRILSAVTEAASDQQINPFAVAFGHRKSAGNSGYVNAHSSSAWAEVPELTPPPSGGKALVAISKNAANDPSEGIYHNVRSNDRTLERAKHSRSDPQIHEAITRSIETDPAEFAGLGIRHELSRVDFSPIELVASDVAFTTPRVESAARSNSYTINIPERVLISRRESSSSSDSSKPASERSFSSQSDQPDARSTQRQDDEIVDEPDEVQKAANEYYMQSRGRGEAFGDQQMAFPAFATPLNREQPPEDENHDSKTDVYDAPNANVRIDHVLLPDDIHRFLLPSVRRSREFSPPRFYARDPSCERERPLLNLVCPTPMPSPSNELVSRQRARSNTSTTEGEDGTSNTPITNRPDEVEHALPSHRDLAQASSGREDDVVADENSIPCASPRPGSAGDGQEFSQHGNDKPSHAERGRSDIDDSVSDNVSQNSDQSGEDTRTPSPQLSIREIDVEAMPPPQEALSPLLHPHEQTTEMGTTLELSPISPTHHTLPTMYLDPDWDEAATSQTAVPELDAYSGGPREAGLAWERHILDQPTITGADQSQEQMRPSSCSIDSRHHQLDDTHSENNRRLDDNGDLEGDRDLEDDGDLERKSDLQDNRGMEEYRGVESHRVLEDNRDREEDWKLQNDRRLEDDPGRQDNPDREDDHDRKDDSDYKNNRDRIGRDLQKRDTNAHDLVASDPRSHDVDHSGPQGRDYQHRNLDVDDLENSDFQEGDFHDCDLGTYNPESHNVAAHAAAAFSVAARDLKDGDLSIGHLQDHSHEANKVEDRNSSDRNFESDRDTQHHEDRDLRTNEVHDRDFADDLEDHNFVYDRDHAFQDDLHHRDPETYFFGDDHENEDHHPVDYNLVDDRDLVDHEFQDHFELRDPEIRFLGDHSAKKHEDEDHDPADHNFNDRDSADDYEVGHHDLDDSGMEDYHLAERELGEHFENHDPQHQAQKELRGHSVNVHSVDKDDLEDCDLHDRDLEDDETGHRRLDSESMEDRHPADREVDDYVDDGDLEDLRLGDHSVENRKLENHNLESHQPDDHDLVESDNDLADHEHNDDDPADQRPDDHDQADHKSDVDLADHEPNDDDLANHRPDSHDIADHKPDDHDPADHEPNSYDLVDHEPDDNDLADCEPDNKVSANYQLSDHDIIYHELDNPDLVDYEPDEKDLADYKPHAHILADHMPNHDLVDSGPDDYDLADHKPDDKDLAGYKPNDHDAADHEPDNHDLVDHEPDNYNPADRQPDDKVPADYKPDDHVLEDYECEHCDHDFEAQHSKARDLVDDDLPGHDPEAYIPQDRLPEELDLDSRDAAHDDNQDPDLGFGSAQYLQQPGFEQPELVQSNHTQRDREDSDLSDRDADHKILGNTFATHPRPDNQDFGRLGLQRLDSDDSELDYADLTYADLEHIDHKPANLEQNILDQIDSGSTSAGRTNLERIDLGYTDLDAADPGQTLGSERLEAENTSPRHDQFDDDHAIKINAMTVHPRIHLDRTRDEKADVARADFELHEDGQPDVDRAVPGSTGPTSPEHVALDQCQVQRNGPLDTDLEHVDHARGNLEYVPLENAKHPSPNQLRYQYIENADLDLASPERASSHAQLSLGQNSLEQTSLLLIDSILTHARQHGSERPSHLSSSTQPLSSQPKFERPDPNHTDVECATSRSPRHEWPDPATNQHGPFRDNRNDVEFVQADLQRTEQKRRRPEHLDLAQLSLEHPTSTCSTPENPETYIDPEIVHRPIKIAIDPQYGDLLPFPPSWPSTPQLQPDDFSVLPSLPESRPETPQREKGWLRDRMATRRRDSGDLSIKSPSQTAIPISVRPISLRPDHRSPRLSLPSSPATSPLPTQTSPATPSSGFKSRRRARPQTWGKPSDTGSLFLIEGSESRSLDERRHDPDHDSPVSWKPHSQPCGLGIQDQDAFRAVEEDSGYIPLDGQFDCSSGPFDPSDRPMTRNAGPTAHTRELENDVESHRLLEAACLVDFAPTLHHTDHSQDAGLSRSGTGHFAKPTDFAEEFMHARDSYNQMAFIFTEPVTLSTYTPLAGTTVIRAEDERAARHTGVNRLASSVTEYIEKPRAVTRRSSCASQGAEPGPTLMNNLGIDMRYWEEENRTAYIKLVILGASAADRNERWSRIDYTSTHDYSSPERTRLSAKRHDVGIYSHIDGQAKRHTDMVILNETTEHKIDPDEGEQCKALAGRSSSSTVPLWTNPMTAHGLIIPDKTPVERIEPNCEPFATLADRIPSPATLLPQPAIASETNAPDEAPTRSVQLYGTVLLDEPLAPDVEPSHLFKANEPDVLDEAPVKNIDVNSVLSSGTSLENQIQLLATLVSQPATATEIDVPDEARGIDLVDEPSSLLMEGETSTFAALPTYPAIVSGTDILDGHSVGSIDLKGKLFRGLPDKSSPSPAMDRLAGSSMVAAEGSELRCETSGTLAGQSLSPAPLLLGSPTAGCVDVLDDDMAEDSGSNRALEHQVLLPVLAQDLIILDDADFDSSDLTSEPYGRMENRVPSTSPAEDTAILNEAEVDGSDLTSEPSGLRDNRVRSPAPVEDDVDGGDLTSEPSGPWEHRVPSPAPGENLSFLHEADFGGSDVTSEQLGPLQDRALSPAPTEEPAIPKEADIYITSLKSKLASASADETHSPALLTDLPTEEGIIVLNAPFVTDSDMSESPTALDHLVTLPILSEPAVQDGTFVYGSDIESQSPGADEDQTDSASESALLNGSTGDSSNPRSRLPEALDNQSPSPALPMVTADMTKAFAKSSYMTSGPSISLEERTVAPAPSIGPAVLSEAAISSRHPCSPLYGPEDDVQQLSPITALDLAAVDAIAGLPEARYESIVGDGMDASQPARCLSPALLIVPAIAGVCTLLPDQDHQGRPRRTSVDQVDELPSKTRRVFESTPTKGRVLHSVLSTPQLLPGISATKKKTPPLRRIKTGLHNVRISDEFNTYECRTPPTGDPVANESRVRATMADVYVRHHSPLSDPAMTGGPAHNHQDGYGEGQIGSPRSPTRPHSMRRKQSLQVLDLQAKCDQLLIENRVLADLRQEADLAVARYAEDITVSRDDSAAVLADRDSQIERLTSSLRTLQAEMKRLTESHEGLTVANAALVTVQGKLRQLETELAMVSQQLTEERGLHDRLRQSARDKDVIVSDLESQVKTNVQALQAEMGRLAQSHQSLAAANVGLETAHKKLRHLEPEFASVSQLLTDERGLHNQLRQSIQDREEVISELKAQHHTNVRALQAELGNLAESHQSLAAENVGLQTAHGKLRHLEPELAAVSQLLTEERDMHSQVRQSMQDKDRIIIDLKAQLHTHVDQIQELQQQIQAKALPESQFLAIYDVDYFDGRCQELFSHAKQWILRFSKLSDMRSCRSTREIDDRKVVNRLDNSVLDYSDPNVCLRDRVKRRDVLLSIMNDMISEFIFSRYLFGMDREQRQKIKNLEKQLAEANPVQAVRQWRARTLTLWTKRSSFSRQCEIDTEAVVQAVFHALCEILPPPSDKESQIQEQLHRVVKDAVDLSIAMRTQIADYLMIPPLQPEMGTVPFDPTMMNEASGEYPESDQDHLAGSLIVRTVLFPVVVKKGEDDGEGDEELVVCPAEVIAVPKTGRQG